MKRAFSILSLWLIFLQGCAVGPDYMRPATPVPATFRGSENAAISDGSSLGDFEWFSLFKDEDLQSLIRTAMASNYDVRIAAERVLEARAQVTIVRSEMFPTIDGNLSWVRQRFAPKEGSPPGADLEQSTHQLTANLSWEVDLLGRIRRATEAARAQMLATEANRDFVTQTLLTDVARAYFELCELDLELSIARRTLASRERSLRLVKSRLDGGQDTLLAARQAESLVLGAAALIPNLKRLIEQKENQISILAGKLPGDVVRSKDLLSHGLTPEIPTGLPSSLLDRRADILTAEQELIAANARIGEAKALFFPVISLTALAGAQSGELTNLLAPGTGIWSTGFALAQPLFNAGRIRANLLAAESRERQAVLRYQKTIQGAFQEVSDSLSAYRGFRDARIERERLNRSLEDQTRLANLRYLGGVTSYLEVLDAERQFFEAELALARERRNELLSVIALYKALGGGWSVKDQVDGKSGL